MELKMNGARECVMCFSVDCACWKDFSSKARFLGCGAGEAATAGGRR